MKMEQSMVDALVKGDASGWDHSLAGTFMFNAAVVTYRSTDHGTYNGKDISGQYRWTDVFVKHNGQWQVVSTQGTHITPPAAMSNK